MKASTNQTVLLVILLISLVLLPLVGACGGDDDDGTQAEEKVTGDASTELGKPVKISQSFALTGAYASQHKKIFNSYEDYIKYINDNGGLKDTEGTSHHVEMLWVDNQMNVNTDISFFEKAKADGSLIHGSLYASSYGALLPKLEKDVFPFNSFSSLNFAIEPQRTGFVLFPYFEDVQGAWVDWFLQTWDEPNPPKLAIIAVDNAYGKGALGDQAIDYIESRGVDVVAKEVVDAVPVDTTANLTKIKNAGADFIWAQIVSPTAAVIARDMKKMDIDLPIASPAAMGPAALLGMAPDACDGWIGMVWAAFVGDNPGTQFCRDLQTQYHGEVVEDDMYMLGLVSVMTVIEAVRLAMEEVPFDELSPKQVWKHGVNRIKDFDTNGIVPPITLGVEHGYYGQNYVRPVQIQGDQLVWIDDFIECPDTMAYHEYYDGEGKSIAQELADK